MNIIITYLLIGLALNLIYIFAYWYRGHDFRLHDFYALPLCIVAWPLLVLMLIAESSNIVLIPGRKQEPK